VLCLSFDNYVALWPRIKYAWRSSFAIGVSTSVDLEIPDYLFIYTFVCLQMV